MIAALQNAWEEIEASDSPPGIVARRFRPDALVDLFVGVQNPGATRLVFVQASRGSFARISSWPESAGFAVSREAVPGDDSKARLVIRLTGPSYRDVFATLVADVIACVGLDMSERDAIMTVTGRLERWQRFLALHGGEGLSLLAQRGLYGELWFLEKFLLPCCGPVVAMRGWTGPLAKDQDFQLSCGSFEVKTSTANPGQRIHVSNVRQLDDSGASELHLVHLALEERHSQGQTLIDLVQQVRSGLGEQVSLFNDRLLDAGYLDAHATRYVSTGYIVKSCHIFRVKDDFPRILEKELRAGVGDVSYTIALGACAPFSVAESDIMAQLREIP